MFETPFFWTKAAEYLENDDEDDEKQTIGEALSAAKDSPLFDVARVWFKAASVGARMWLWSVCENRMPDRRGMRGFDCWGTYKEHLICGSELFQFVFIQTSLCWLSCDEWTHVITDKPIDKKQVASLCKALMRNRNLNGLYLRGLNTSQQKHASWVVWCHEWHDVWLSTGNQIGGKSVKYISTFVISSARLTTLDLCSVLAFDNGIDCDEVVRLMACCVGSCWQTTV